MGGSFVNRTRAILLVFGALALLLVGLSVYNVSRLDLGACSNEVIATASSPDGRIDAVVFQRSCGASTSFSTHLSLVEEGTELPDEYGNVLSIRGRPSETIAGIEWAGAERLTVFITTDQLIDQRRDHPFDVEVILERPDR